MLLALGLATGIWGAGYLLGTPPVARWLSIALLYVAVLAANVALPEGNALRAALGGSPAGWLLLGGAGAAVWAYAQGLRRLRLRVPRGKPSAASGPEAASAAAFAPGELDRYARHIVLREIGGAGQRRLKAARVLVVGAGGLGAPALQYLAAAGVGTLGVIDDDLVEATNLQRQVIHSEAWIGKPKVFSTEAAIRALNQHVAFRPYHRRLEPAIAADLFAEYDLILDGTDHYPTRELVNRTAVALRKPLIGGALSQWEGQVSLYDPASGGPCHACVFPEAPAPGLAPPCAEAGVLGPLPGVVGAMMAVEAVKEITGAGETLRGRLLLYDALCADVRVIRLRRRENCAVCGGVPGGR